MSIVLHRFPLSHFSEKGRALLDFKGLDYSLKDYQLGLPQLRIRELSGQRKVPVLEHDGRIVHDTTRIAHYLDETFPDRRRLIPESDPRRSEVLALEDRIDRTFGLGPVVLWVEHCLDHRDHLDLLAVEVHGLSVAGARGVGALAGLLRDRLFGRFKRAIEKTFALLDDVDARLRRHPYLVGDEPSLADLAAVGLLFHLEFPPTRFLWDPSFTGRGVEHVVARYPEVFAWRRKFYADHLR